MYYCTQGISFKKGEQFPFKSHYPRIERYRENMKLFKGEHYDIFRKYNAKAFNDIYIAVNLAGLICKKSADLLLGEEPIISAGKEDNSNEQMAIDRFTNDNFMDIVNYESALFNAVKGDSFYRVRYGQENGGIFDGEEYRVFIEGISPEYVYPEVSPLNKKQIIVYHYCVPAFDDATDGWVLTCESHGAGYVLYHSYNIKPTQVNVLGEAEKFNIEDMIGEPQYVLTGVNKPLIVHIPNMASGDCWEGLDDLSENKGLFDELNNRLSQIASILDKHADPAMAVPVGLLQEDEAGNAKFRVAVDKVFEVLGKDDIMPQYITWNGNLQEAITEMKEVVSLILMNSEIPAIALGLSDTGTSGSSGLSIKFRMNSLLSKIKRKRLYYKKGLKQVYTIAQELETALGIANYKIVDPHIKFNDGLPTDDLQDANIMNVRTGGAVTMSQKTAIMRLDNMTEEQAEAELLRIEEEQKTASNMIGSPSIFNDYDGQDGEGVDPALEASNNEANANSKVLEK